MDNTFLVCTQDDSEVSWLQSSLIGYGKVVQASENLEELFRLVDLMSASLVFMTVSRHHQVSQCVLIESLLESRPMVAVVAIGDGYDSELTIAAMRAGARDFITYGLRGSEVMGIVRRVMARLPQLPSRPDQADVTFLYGAQPDPDASFVATHLAVALAEGGCNTLLVDIGVPTGESKAILGVECTFGFEDALRNLRRMDATVIDSAFSVHDSGLTILPLCEGSFSLESCNSAELFLLFGCLRQHFTHMVINACGIRDSELLRSLAGSSQRLYWYVDQSVSCSQRNLSLLHQWRVEGAKLDHAALIVDRYISQAAPDVSTLARMFDLPVKGFFPLNAHLRLRSRNQGRTTLDLSPKDSLSRSLLKLSLHLGSNGKGKKGLLRRLIGVR
ncbi:pilus assembly protein [uncultured Porticoccus sp.]|uniref:pilus assembly protein n=1 Tax=uncultured Porticoccus sp. TaxID=1256050 RepID=UPI00260F8308|nr:pilus assembly protein [uncultured Porticoccus sp.]